jgi:hypothetical protein
MLFVLTIALIAPLGVAPSTAAAVTISTSADPADGWRAIGPLGNLEGQPISEVGLDWEASKPGWNTSLAFDDSDAAGWNLPVPRDVSPYGGTSTNNIWSDGEQGSGATPAYFRKIFTLDADAASAQFGSDLFEDFSNVIDDDAQIYINGILVYDDQDGEASFIPVTDVTTYLHTGENLLAVKAHDSFGADEHFSLNLEIQAIPEPTSVSLLALGLAGLALRRQRRNL